MNLECYTRARSPESLATNRREDVDIDHNFAAPDYATSPAAFRLKTHDSRLQTLLHLYLETDDATATAEALKRNGVHLVKDVHETAWGTREFVIKDDHGHTM
jgi:uncharacterized glyoxalase superfamily protein PhnB